MLWKAEFSVLLPASLSTLFMEYVACMEVLKVKEDLCFMGSKVKCEVEEISSRIQMEQEQSAL